MKIKEEDLKFEVTRVVKAITVNGDCKICVKSLQDDGIEFDVTVGIDVATNIQWLRWAVLDEYKLKTIEHKNRRKYLDSVKLKNGDII